MFPELNKPRDKTIMKGKQWQMLTVSKEGRGLSKPGDGKCQREKIVVW